MNGTRYSLLIARDVDAEAELLAREGAHVIATDVAAAYAVGASFDDIHRRVWETDDFRPDELPDFGAPPPRPGDPPMPAKW